MTSQTLEEVAHALDLSEALARAGLKPDVRELLIADEKFALYIVKFAQFVGDDWESPVQLTFEASTELKNASFSTRTYNALAREGLQTLGELSLCSEWELRDIRSFGNKSVKEVVSVLRSAGLHLAADGETRKEAAIRVYGSLDEVPEHARGYLPQS
jgi:hypothetical protein